MDSLSVSAATRLSGARAFSMAGVSAKDFDLIELYDALTRITPPTLESLGVAKPGEGAQFVSGDRTTPGGIPSTPTAAACRTPIPACTASSR